MGKHPFAQFVKRVPPMDMHSITLVFRENVQSMLPKPFDDAPSQLGVTVSGERFSG